MLVLISYLSHIAVQTLLLIRIEMVYIPNGQRNEVMNTNPDTKILFKYMAPLLHIGADRTYVCLKAQHTSHYVKARGELGVP